MKKFSWLIAVFAILALAFVFVSCDPDGGDDCEECEQDPCICLVPADIPSGAIELPVAFGGLDGIKVYIVPSANVSFASNKVTVTNNSGFRVRFYFDYYVDVTPFKGILFSGHENGNWNIGFGSPDPFESGAPVNWGSTAGGWGLYQGLTESGDAFHGKPANEKKFHQMELFSDTATAPVEFTGFVFED